MQHVSDWNKAAVKCCLALSHLEDGVSEEIDSRSSCRRKKIRTGDVASRGWRIRSKCLQIEGMDEVCERQNGRISLAPKYQ